jgi:predicted  nucleic acid-binding Zn-ribbon protein
MRGMDRLLELQEIDTAIDRLVARQTLLEAGKAVEAARAEADTAEASLGELGLRTDELDRDQARFEHEIDSLNRKAADEEKRLYDGSVANAKELGSLQHEVENLRRRRSDREDELLVLMERREELEAQVAELREIVTRLRSEVDRVIEDELSERAAVTAELDARRGQRDAVTPAIDEELLELYDDLRPQKKGVAAAALVDGVCQGCHEQLSAVERDRLKRTDGVRRCDHCRRILVF